MQTFKGYAASIAKATGVTNPIDLEEIEETMRQDIFHSTLDWISPARFAAGACEAWALVQFIRSPVGAAQFEALRQEMLA